MQAPSLTLTGERTLPGVPEENYWFRRHEAAYSFLAPRAAGHALVVEIGCGEGYGSALLAEQARRVLAIDYDKTAIRHATRSYPRPMFVQGNLASVPLGNRVADMVVSLQVIEHVWDHAEYVQECVRVLRPGHMLALSTPNRLTFSPGADGGTPPTNPFHTHEFTASELHGLLEHVGLKKVRTLGLFAGPRLAEFDIKHGGSFVQAQLATPPQQWSAVLRSDVSSVRTDDFAICPAEADQLDTALDLIVLAAAP